MEVVYKTPGGLSLKSGNLGAEPVQGLALALEGVHDVERRHRLAAGMLGVRDGILDDVLEERLQDAAGLLVHHTGDALHTATASQAADRGLGDALDVVALDLAVALGAGGSLLTTLSASRHDD